MGNFSSFCMTIDNDKTISYYVTLMPYLCDKFYEEGLDRKHFYNSLISLYYRLHPWFARVMCVMYKRDLYELFIKTFRPNDSRAVSNYFKLS